LIDAAREDYLNRAPWELRHIKEFEGFIQSLKNDNVKRADGKPLSKWAKLKHNIPAMVSEKYLDVPILKLEDIRKAVLSCGVNEKLTKALILTFLSSGQAQAEIQKLEGRHLKNVVNGVAVVNMTRGKTNRRFTFFIGSEALTAIHDYKVHIKDYDLIFTQKTSNKALNDPYIGMIFRRLAAKLGWERAYFQPHRFRHYFKSQLSDSMDTTFIEYLLGHKLPGVESNYFLGNQDKMLEEYIKNQDKDLVKNHTPNRCVVPKKFPTYFCPERSSQGMNLGRSKKPISVEESEIIKKAFQRFKFGARMLEPVIVRLGEEKSKTDAIIDAIGDGMIIQDIDFGDHISKSGSYRSLRRPSWRMLLQSFSRQGCYLRRLPC
jgi:integrase